MLPQSEDEFSKFTTDFYKIYHRQKGKQLELKYKSDKVKFSDDMRVFIESSWRKAKEKWPKMYDDKLYHVNRHEVDRSYIILEVIDSNYKEYVGSRDPEFEELFGPKYVIRPLGVGVIAVTGDDKILIGKRESVDTWKGYHGTIAGYVQLPKNSSFPPDINETVIRELFEEAAIRKDEIAMLRFLGVTSYSQLVYEVELKTLSSEFFSRAPIEREFGEFRFIEENKKSLANFIRRHKAKITPISLASLIYFGIKNYGKSWLTSLHTRA